MLIDRYTKAVLTVIAGALVLLAVQNFSSPATAQMSGCGLERLNPCYISSGKNGFELIVTMQ